MLGLRLVIFIALLALVFTAAELWRRAVFRYVQDPRRRSRFLLLRKIVLWALVVAIAAATFATELGSLATFAGLITAGLAVAMQSVLISVVGYFFLIGKYGIRVGDRVQQHVGVTVADQTAVVLDPNAAEDQRPVGRESMAVLAEADAIFHTTLRRPHGRRPARS